MPEDTRPQKDLDLIERFIAAFNAIDQYLQRVIGSDERSSFRNLLDIYAHQHKWWRDADRLRTFAQLRNVIVHDKTEPYTYICVPTAATVADIEAIRDYLVHPPQVIPAFARDVIVIQPQDSLAQALTLIDQHQYSRLPVYDGTRFVGLLTENGITHWLAHRVASGGGPANFNIPVRDVLPREQKRPNFQFVRRDTAVDQVAYQFHDNTFLEAVLITRNGGSHEPLLGIITRGDVVQFWS